MNLLKIVRMICEGVFFCIIGIFFSAQAQDKLNIVMCLGGEDMQRVDSSAITCSLLEVINNDNPNYICLTDFASLYNIVEFNFLNDFYKIAFKKLLQKEWQIFELPQDTSKNGLEDALNTHILFLLVHKNFFKKNTLKDSGFALTKLISLDILQKKTKKVFDALEYEGDDELLAVPSVDVIKKVFPKSKIKKRIMVLGHGSPWLVGEKGLFGGLALDDYKKFEQYLHDDGSVEFLGGVSCFGGGLHAQEIGLQQVGFVRIIVALSDSLVCWHAGCLEKFFIFLDTVADLNNLNKKDKQKLIAFLQLNISAVPLLCLPGQKKFEVLAKDDEVVVITDDLVQKMGEDKVVIVADPCKAILFYPISVPISIEVVSQGIKVPSFVSLIPGKAKHFIKKISMKNANLHDFVNSFFVKILSKDELKKIDLILFNKQLFCIKKLNIKNSCKGFLGCDNSIKLKSVFVFRDIFCKNCESLDVIKQRVLMVFEYQKSWYCVRTKDGSFTYDEKNSGNNCIELLKNSLMKVKPDVIKTTHKKIKDVVVENKLLKKSWPDIEFILNKSLKKFISKKTSVSANKEIEEEKSPIKASKEIGKNNNFFVEELDSDGDNEMKEVNSSYKVELEEN